MIFAFFLSSLACFRLSRLFAEDKITDWLRVWLIKEAPTKAKAKVKQGVSCPFCWSFYFSLIITFALWWNGDLIDHQWLWLPAIWGASILINELFTFLMSKSK